MQWFKASGWSHNPVIKPIEVIKETDHFLVIPNRWLPGGKPNRVAKDSDGECYFQTWEAARDFLLAQVEDRVKNCRYQLERANGALGNVKGWKKPETEHQA